jgi:hypothetical protein
LKLTAFNQISPKSTDFFSVRKDSFGEATASGIRATASGIKANDSVIGATAPAVEATAPGIKATAPGIEATASAIGADASGIKTINSGAEANALAIKSFAPNIKTIASCPKGGKINDAAMFTWLIAHVETFTSAKEERVNYKNLIRSGVIGSSVGAVPAVPNVAPAPVAVAAGIFPRIAKIVQQIKGKSNYTDAIGKDLGIIGAEQIVDQPNMKPVLALVLKGGHVEVQWAKGHSDGIRIEADKGSGWQFLAVDTIPNYTDTAPIAAPGTWKYRAMYFISDEPVGQWSDVAGITVGA